VIAVGEREYEPKIEVPEAAPSLKPALEAAAKSIEEKLARTMESLRDYISALRGGESSEEAAKQVKALEEFILSFKQLTTANPYMAHYESEYFVPTEKEELIAALETLESALIKGDLDEKRDAWRHFRRFEKFVREFYSIYDVTGIGPDEAKAYSGELRSIVTEIGRQFERFK